MPKKANGLPKEPLDRSSAKSRKGGIERVMPHRGAPADRACTTDLWCGRIAGFRNRPAPPVATSLRRGHANGA